MICTYLCHSQLSTNTDTRRLNDQNEDVEHENNVVPCLLLYYSDDLICFFFYGLLQKGSNIELVSLADLQKDEDQAYRKIRLRAEDVQGKNVLTNFWTLIEAHVDVKTTDSYTLGMFCIGFTKKLANQPGKSYS
ncbi:hypothetical protein POM88_009681 [Heracleum sosnowskyi]|uniref:Uncharacterized protein n=1 Tax=Heracleum sosnowskyi TaxID=360622 RepID=A0AAD8J9L2_9APIA|nr:hypothetical protein POM88_009681 [Heracleum sosnowskyi]